MKRIPSLKLLAHDSREFENQQRSILKNGDDFILLNDGEGNPLVFNNAHARKIKVNKICIQCMVNGYLLGCQV